MSSTATGPQLVLPPGETRTPSTTAEPGVCAAPSVIVERLLPGALHRDPTHTDPTGLVPAWKVLRRVRLRALQESPDAFPVGWQDEAQLEQVDWTRRLSDSDWVISQEGRGGPVIGVARLKGIPAPDHGPEDPLTVRHIESVWVHPRRRGAGVARRMIDELEALVRTRNCTAAPGFRIEKLLLWLHADNDDAWRAYRRMGFCDPAGSQTSRLHRHDLITACGQRFPERRMERRVGERPGGRPTDLSTDLPAPASLPLS